MHVGTGISVYTAFFAFGAVRIAPDVALNPILWAVPLLVGLAIIGYHMWKLPREKTNSRPMMAPTAAEQSPA